MSHTITSNARQSLRKLAVMLAELTHSHHVVIDVKDETCYSFSDRDAAEHYVATNYFRDLEVFSNRVFWAVDQFLRSAYIRKMTHTDPTVRKQARVIYTLSKLVGQRAVMYTTTNDKPADVPQSFSLLVTMLDPCDPNNYLGWAWAVHQLPGITAGLVQDV